MSLGGGASTALDTAVGNSIADGVTYAVAAGNEQRRTPATPRRRARAEAITVGATTSTDARASFSNYGTVPGHLRAGLEHHLRLAHERHRHEHDQRHLDGLAARRGRGRAVPAGQPAASPAQVRAALIDNATTGVVTNPGTGSPNRLLFTGPAATPTPPTSCAASPTPGSFTASRQSGVPGGRASPPRPARTRAA